MPPYIREYVFENVGLDDRTQSVCVPTGRLPSASYSAPARPPPTMGKCGTRDAEAMKLAMCEDLRTAGISHLREDHDEMEKTPVPAATAVRRPDAGGDDDDDTRTLKPPCRVHHQEATGRGADERQGNRTLLVNVNSRLNADNELCSIGEVSSKDTSSHNGSTEHLLEDPSQSPPVKDSFQLLAKEELYDSKKPRFFPDNLELSPTNNVLSQIADGGLLNSPTSSTSPVDDVSVIVGPNNRLSTVLENIPLLYIPKTKQLVSHQWSGLIKDNGFVESINQFSNINSSLSDVRYVPMTEKLQFEDEIISIKDDLELDSPVSTLPRTNTSDSLIRTDVSSLSSISTDITGSVASVSDDYHDGRGAVPEGLEAGFIEINLHSRNSYERTKIHSRYCVMDGKEDKSKRKSLGLSGFLAKNLFRKHRDHEESEPGWKLFGRVPPKETTHKNPSQISEEYQAKHRTAQLTTARRARKDIEVMSTTALILENRPGNLPSKAPEEERKHKQEYEAMVEAAKKREQRELKQKKKDLQQQLRHEEQLVAAARCWNSDILPSWDVMKSSKKARDLWWQGLPPSVRGKVWKLAIGNELNITSELYDICLNRAKDKIKALNESVDSHQLSDASEHSSSKEASVELIKLDVSRTFPQLCIFQKGGPYHDLLHSLLGAYACYRPDVGYVQGMSFLAAVLLLNMDVADAFICFANLLNGPCQVAFFRVDEEMMKSYFNTYEEFLEENMAELYQHFENQSFTPDIYIIDWIFTLYSKSLPLDVACRVWDVFCRDGEEFLFRTALGILRLYEDILLKMDFIHLAEFLTKLPEDISSEQLFQNVQTVRMIKDKKKFAQVLMGQRDAKDLSKSDYFS